MEELTPQIYIYWTQVLWYNVRVTAIPPYQNHQVMYIKYLNIINKNIHTVYLVNIIIHTVYLDKVRVGEVLISRIQESSRLDLQIWFLPFWNALKNL